MSTLLKSFTRVELLILVLLLFAGSCSTSRTGVKKSGKSYQSGMASWYGPKFHGRQTANGERYDMDKLTAAHRTLPFDTYVRVLNRDNGREVTVRINDRGPFAKGRIIDLSRAAANKIGMIGPGIARVELTIIRQGSTEGNTAPPKNSGVYANPDRGNFTIQIGSYEHRKTARKQARTINGARVEKAKLQGKTFYRVYYGTYKSKNKAQKKLAKLRRKGINGFVKNL